MTDSDGDTIVTRSYKTVIETFSIWAAVSFVVSGLVAALLFYAKFRMNYFEVAQPADIVMAGFINVAFVSFFAFLFGAVFYLQYNVVKIWRLTIGRFFKDRPMEHVLKYREEKFKKITRIVFPINFILSGVMVFVFQFIAGVTSISVDWHGVHFAKSQRVGYWDRPLSDRGVSNLYLSEASDQFSTCGHAPVLWMGSSSVILNCKGRARLIQNTENLYLDRFSPSEMADMQEIELLKAKASLLRAIRTSGGKPQADRAPAPGASPKASGR